MESLCPCGHEPTGSIVPVSSLVSYKPYLIENTENDVLHLVNRLCIGKTHSD